MITKVFKFAFRAAVVGGLGLGALAVGSSVLGTERTDALISQVQQGIHERLDAAVDDPTALRSQLRRLEQAYPERIATLSADVAEVNQEIERARRETAIAERVVELADRDLTALGEQLGGLEGLRPASNIQVAQAGYDTQQLVTRQHQIQQTRLVYSNRASEAGREIAVLSDQRDRLEQALQQLQTEQAQFQAQLVSIERQVDAIARNERLIEMMEKRQHTLDELNRYQAAKLDDVVGRLNAITSRQEAELDVLTNQTRQVSYEDMARMELEDETRATTILHSEQPLQLIPRN